MTAWTYTDEADAFIATADSRETDKRIMEAIAFFARDLSEAEAFWSGDFSRRVDYNSIWEYATNNGLLDGYEMFWGDAGNLNLICGTEQPEFARVGS